MLRRLSLQSFRNYERQDIEFAPGLNLITGENGQGKTNILEAVYYLSLLRSFRTQKVIELRNFGQANFTIYGEGENANGPFTLGVSNGEIRRLVVNGVPCSLTSNFISKFICAAFIPEDLNIVKGAPVNRRRFLDILLCQLSPEYLRALQAYGTALQQRNAMLKQPERFSKNSITAYNHILVEKAGIIEMMRKEHIGKINEALEAKSREFFGGKRIISLKYLSGCGSLLKDIEEDRAEFEKNYAEQLEKHYDLDIQMGTTRFGPHRSEFSCLLDNRQLAAFGSEGECRTAALALKLASIEILYQGVGKNDVTLVVDDVLGELDDEKRKIFFKLLGDAGQVLLACTSIPNGLQKYDKIFHVSHGKLI